MMIFEVILFELKVGKCVVWIGWEGIELFVELQMVIIFNGDLLNLYFLIKMVDEVYSMWLLMDCDILVMDWQLVD